jgi:hypothetical protein
MLRKLSASDFEKEAKNSFFKIFNDINPDPFREPFTNEIEEKRILFYYRYFASLELMEKIQTSVQMVYGEEGFYILIRGWHPDDRDIYRGIHHHWYTSFDAYKEYLDTGETYLESAFYSPKGNWGIVSSDEDHAVIGGSLEFIQDLRMRISDLDNQVYGFLDLWQIYREKLDLPMEWMPIVMNHIYGEKKAKNILINNGFKFLYKE